MRCWRGFPGVVGFEESPTMSFLCEVFPPEADALSPICPSAISSRDENVLFEIFRPDVALAIWLRPMPSNWKAEIGTLLQHLPFGAIGRGSPEDAVDQIVQELPAPASAALLSDMLLLGRFFATITQQSEIRANLAGVNDDSCRRFHCDAVRLRLLCTYHGPGTQFTMCGPQCRAPHQIPALAVALVKGRAHPAALGDACLHRSPPVSHLPESRRGRLLFCIDEPGFLP
ncbi:MAG: DUF1826 domain-containing protein [Roseomonas sp.]|nr:DUF1826 domain-containing protein [Roseomonas sp.]